MGRAQLLNLKKEEEDRQNHNFVSLSDQEQALTSDVTKDVSFPSEDRFMDRFKVLNGKHFASTPAPRVLPGKLLKRRSMSLDIMVRTPIIPGRCKQCAIRARGSRRGGEDSLDSPQLPWCPHGSNGSDSSDLLLQSPCSLKPRALKSNLATAGKVKSGRVKEASIDVPKITDNLPEQEAFPGVDIEVTMSGDSVRDSSLMEPAILQPI